AKEFGISIAYVNLVGGQDELVFDGRSFVFSLDGELLARAKAFKQDLLTVSIPEGKLRPAPIREKSSPPTKKRLEDSPEGDKEVLMAIELSLKDYCQKNSFEKVVVGVSGGIDSALVCAISCRVLGPENVLGVFMPSPYTSKESKILSKELSSLCGFELREIEISGIYSEFLKLLGSNKLSVAEENLQSRIRAIILYYISNRENRLLLSTSNKSELAVGYSTIGGDMSGGFAPIKDLYKTRVYSLAELINSIQKLIPEGIISRPPSAELRLGQRDEDELMPYKELDRMIDMFLKDEPLSEFDLSEVQKITRMLKLAEFKRKQAPVGPKLTPVAFGKDWRMPITSGFEKWI
ncbi:MAG: NAD(+) synthase, partial [Aquificaceae bacterium]